jgi:hypothetical protein
VRFLTKLGFGLRFFSKTEPNTMQVQKHHDETKLMHSSSSSLRVFQRDQEHDLKYPGLVDLNGTKTKQTNNLPS